MSQSSLLYFVALFWCVYALKYPPGYPNLGHSHYKYMNTTTPWEEGFQMCADINGTMAVPDSKGERLFLLDNYMPKIPAYTNIWIGCDDMDIEGTYVQRGRNGKECEYIEWQHGQPTVNTRDRQDCLVLDKQTGRFSDNPCTNNALIICENPAIPSTTCQRQDSADHFIVRCLTNGFTKDLKGKSDLLSAKFCRDDPRCRSLALAMGGDGQAICQPDSVFGLTQGKRNSCQYLYI